MLSSSGVAARGGSSDALALARAVMFKYACDRCGVAGVGIRAGGGEEQVGGECVATMGRYKVDFRRGVVVAVAEEAFDVPRMEGDGDKEGEEEDLEEEGVGKKKVAAFAINNDDESGGDVEGNEEEWKKEEGGDGGEGKSANSPRNTKLGDERQFDSGGQSLGSSPSQTIFVKDFVGSDFGGDLSGW